MNGNVDLDGIRADLTWMQQTGLGGFVLVEGALPGAQRVAEPVRFGSPAWQAAVRTAAQEAAERGLVMGINTSPGWSISGGPWVRPADAMRKLVWSEVDVQGGTTVRLQLPAPPSTTGPYQDIGEAHGTRERFYEDAAVVAFRVPRDAGVLQPQQVLASSAEPSSGLPAIDRLLDGRHDQSWVLAPQGDAQQAWVTYRFDAPQTVRSVQIGLPGPRGFGAPPPPHVQLQVSDDGQQWRTVVTLPATPSFVQPAVRTVAFAPVQARWFRLWLDRPDGAGGMPPVAPGAVPLGMPPQPLHYTLTEWRLYREGRVHQAEAKAGYGTLADEHGAATPADAVAAAPALRDVVDLRGHVDAQGRLQWQAPPGHWRVLRFGASLTGHQNGPAAAEATGLEVDKLDADRVRRYIDTYLGFFEQAIGPQWMGARGLQLLQADSIESGLQNWTTRLPEAFAKRRGYALTRWMPALTGVVIDSAEATDRFLEDYRRTIAELLAEAHYGTLADAAHRRGLTFQAEALEDHRPQLGDDEAMRRHADVPMGAMWQLGPDGQPRSTFVADLRGAASVAHVWGRRWVAAEAFTAFGAPYAASPKDLKTTADWMFALGVNQLNIHTSPHQPAQARAPGMALAVQLGQYFSRHETWADMARPWIDYLARSSQLLQQGRAHADVAYFYGESTPITGLFGQSPQQDVPPGYGVDLVGRDGLLQRLRVIDGQLGTVDGQRYAVLVLGGTSGWMTLTALQQVERLVRAGATVVGRAPQQAGHEGSVATFARLRQRVWGTRCTDGSLRRVGRGRVLCTDDVAAALQRLALAPDWQLLPAAGADIGADARSDTAAPPQLLHRRLDDPTQTHLYFIANPTPRAWSGTVSLRARGKTVALWRADGGTHEAVPHHVAGARTEVPLALAAGDAVFVVLRGRDGAAATSAAVTSPQPAPAFKERLTLAGPWQLRFQADRGAPTEVLVWPRLQSYTAVSDPGIRYFSGVATYRHTFQWSPAAGDSADALWLDLGEVADLAQVWINGQAAGTVWRPPYRVPVGRWLRVGDNTLEVKVANVWVNRLIGDAQPGAIPVAQTVAPAYSQDAPLRPAGLLGPVHLGVPASTAGP